MQDIFVVVHPDVRYRQQLGVDRVIDQMLERHPDWSVWWEVSTPRPDWQWIQRPRANPMLLSHSHQWGRLDPPLRAWCMGWHTNWCVLDWIRDCMPGQGESWIVPEATVALDAHSRPCASQPTNYARGNEVSPLLRSPPRSRGIL